MRAFFQTLLTSQDNQTYDVGRVLLALLVLAFIAFSGIALLKGQQWEPVGWATAAGGLLMAGSGGLLLKQKTEPQR